MNSPNILIMVLSSYQPPYGQLMDAQNYTWNSIREDGVETLFYSGGHPHDKVDLYGEAGSGTITMDMQFSIRDDYYYMAGKFKLALERVGIHLYDYIFRTNSSSYVNKKRLKEFAATLPTEKLYAGWEIEGNAGYNVVSGAGIFLSRDTAEILRDKIDPTFEREEDVVCGAILHEAGIKIIDDKSRYDYNGNDLSDVMYRKLATKYHIRFKTGDRIQDANNMRLVHQKIISNE